ncbi:MAG: hypothetical protein JWM41_2772 [Gemmatimonadetes bacterium]|jgi:hypothetical protein|nr:hypothetical protein [Gemmatimonadota bacterium]
MPRALTIQRTLVTPPDRARFHEKLKRKHEYYAKANCRFWAFEEAGLPGAFLEFFEADDAATLARAHAGAPEPVLDPNRVYTEVELR